MNVAFEIGWLYEKAQLLIEELDETMKAMVRSFIAAINQGLGTVDVLHRPILFIQPRNIRVAFPEISTHSPHIRKEPARITTV